MKKTILFTTLAIFTLMGCIEDKSNISPVEAKEKVIFNDSTVYTQIGIIDKMTEVSTKIYIIKYDGCEYLLTVSYDSRGGVSSIMRHTSSCTNPIHQHNTKDDVDNTN